MKTVIDMNGKIIKIDNDDYKNLKKAFDDGYESMGFKVKGKYVTIPLDKNFARTGFIFPWSQRT